MTWNKQQNIDHITIDYWMDYLDNAKEVNKMVI